MFSFILKRLAIMIPTLFLVSVMVFCLLKFLRAIRRLRLRAKSGIRPSSNIFARNTVSISPFISSTANGWAAYCKEISDCRSAPVCRSAR